LGKAQRFVAPDIALDGEIDLRTLTDAELRGLKRRLLAAAASNGG
jgi:hypothetical protein